MAFYPSVMHLSLPRSWFLSMFIFALCFLSSRRLTTCATIPESKRANKVTRPATVVTASRNVTGPTRKVDVRLPGKGDSNSHGARPVRLIITMINWIRTSRLSIKNALSNGSRNGNAGRGEASGGLTASRNVTGPVHEYLALKKHPLPRNPQ